jgi:GTP-binding protein
MSTYPNVKFVTSAAEAHQLAPDTGRKSPLRAARIPANRPRSMPSRNASGLARVSRTPGRTQLINFFELAPERRLVDLPGYGFAKVPERVRSHWLQLMEHYFKHASRWSV